MLIQNAPPSIGVILNEEILIMYTFATWSLNAPSLYLPHCVIAYTLVAYEMGNVIVCVALVVGVEPHCYLPMAIQLKVINPICPIDDIVKLEVVRLTALQHSPILYVVVLLGEVKIEKTALKATGKVIAKALSSLEYRCPHC